MSSTSQRLIDAEGAGDVSMHGPLHGLFRGKGAPNNLARSFSSIWALGQSNTNDLELHQDSLQVVKELAMDFAENLILRNDRNLMSEEIRASVSVLTVNEAAAVCAYTMEFGPYKALNKLLRDENRQLLKPFVEYLWLLMHGLSKCPRPIVPLVYRGVSCSVGASYNVGSIVIWSSFSSCTTRVGVLENDMFLGKEGERTEFHITLTTNRARSIRHLSVVPGEDEILLPPNTRLRVMDKADRGHGWCVVQLLEERCLDPILVFPDPPGRCSRSIFDNFTHLPKRPQPLALFPDPPNRHFGINFLGKKTMVSQTSPRPHQLRLSRFRLLPLLLLLQNPVCTKPLPLFLVCCTVPFVYSCPAHSPTIRRAVY